MESQGYQVLRVRNKQALSGTEPVKEAVPAALDLEMGAKKKDLLRAMEGKVLAEGRLMGRYRRR